MEEVYVSVQKLEAPPSKPVTKADRVRVALRHLEYIAEEVSHSVNHGKELDFDPITSAVEDLMDSLGSRVGYKIRIPYVLKECEDESLEVA